MTAEPRRLLFKLSGESLGGHEGGGLDTKVLLRLGEQIKILAAEGHQIAIILGGGNFIRGAAFAERGMERVDADFMGMLATIMNAVAMRDQLRQLDCPARIMSALPVGGICEPYIRERALSHLAKKRVLLLAGGAGLPYFSTDMAAVLRASELQCSVMLKGTQVDGVYSQDPKCHADAIRYERLTLQTALTKNIRVMDGAATALARDVGLTIIIFPIASATALIDVVHRRGRFSILDGNPASDSPTVP